MWWELGLAVVILLMSGFGEFTKWENVRSGGFPEPTFQAEEFPYFGNPAAVPTAVSQFPPQILPEPTKKARQF
ncbi:hypothetical protein ACFQ4L_00955 [Lapidilactobacillus mulanensis]|uniref:Uncharacterized protein n=1 Tax=Lapidilactobacillus mulanensis TaxID=2485999 RepID=A0ABW4DJ22_9LACO|nr:hypothetical protein [Lapidilactobacillus mulanensis]